MELRIDFVGEELNRVDFGARIRVFLGIQCGEKPIDLAPASVESATFAARFSVAPLPDGKTNFLGPYAHGPRTARFAYLCWLSEEDDGRMRQFGRIKIPLGALRWEEVEPAARAGTTLTVRFSLVGRNGGPIAASVPADALHWS